MTDIFISYANEDRDRAARLAAHLETIGWRVWWDRRIPAGRTWRAVLSDALSEMRCMIVLWSAHSVESPWVAEEAEETRRLGKTLVPVLIERVEPPMGFRTIQAADLIDWNGSPNDPAMQQLVADLTSFLGIPCEKPQDRREFVVSESTGVPVAEWISHYWRKASVSALGVLAIIAIWQYWPIAKYNGDAPVAETSQMSAQTTPLARLEGLTVRASRRSLKPEETLKLTAKGRYSDGSENDVENGIEWSSSNTRVAVVDDDGEVRALKSGTTNIVAKIGVVVSSEWTLGVETAKTAAKPPEPRMVALTISSDKNELLENEKIALQARAKYSDDSERILIGGIAWQTSDRAIATIDDRGELQALRPGKVEVVARMQNLASAPETFQVQQARRLVKPAEPPIPPPVKPAGLTDRAKAKIADHLNRAQTYREQGNYAAALAELEQAKVIDNASAEIRREIEQTKRACNAEKILGNQLNC